MVTKQPGCRKIFVVGAAGRGIPESGIGNRAGGNGRRPTCRALIGRCVAAIFVAEVTQEAFPNV